MTLKHYLFILIALLVVGSGGLQLAFISYLQQQVDQEVMQRSETLSNMAVEVLHENLETQIKEHVMIRPLPTEEQKASNEEHNEAANNNRGITSTSSQVKMIVLEPHKQDIGELPEEEQQQFDAVQQLKLSAEVTTEQFVKPDIKIRLEGDTYQFALAQNGEQVAHRQRVKFAHQDSVIQRYFNILIYVTLTLTAIGLLCAFCLAHKVSRPFHRLNQGFQQLAKGAFGTQVKEDGIADVRRTLQQFNVMSQQLSELKAMEQHVQQQEHLVEISELSRGLAHTLRNPLNTIGLAVEQLCRGTMPDEQRRRIEQQVRQKIQHLDKTIKAMMNLTSQDIDRSQPVNINQLLQDILMELRFSSSINIDFQPQQTWHLNGSESEFRTILHSLLSNAVEASEEGEVVTVSIEQDIEAILIHVADQGRGLSADIRENLFKPHVSSKAEGAGMGLFIAQRLCASRYQGDISLKDNEPKGCIATVRIPCNRETKSKTKDSM